MHFILLNSCRVARSVPPGLDGIHWRTAASALLHHCYLQFSSDGHTLWFQGRCWHHPHSLCQSGGVGSHHHWGEMENLVLMTLSSHTASSEVSADPGEAESPESHRSTIPWWADGAVGERRTVVLTGGNSGICRWGQNSGITQKKHSEYSDLYYSPFLTAFQSFQAQIEAFLSFSLNSNWSDWIHKFEPLKRVINSVLSMLVLL